MATERGRRAQQLIDDVTQYVDQCEEAHALLEFAEHPPEPIVWRGGESLRDVLRIAKRRAEGQQP